MCFCLQIYLLFPISPKGRGDFLGVVGFGLPVLCLYNSQTNGSKAIPLPLPSKPYSSLLFRSHTHLCREYRVFPYL